MESVIASPISSVRKIVDNLFLYTRNVDNLRAQILALKIKRARLKHHVDEAERYGKRVGRLVRNWLSRADDILAEGETFLNDVEGHAKATFPSLGTRNRLSREAKEKMQAVSDMLNEGKLYVFKGEETFETRKPILEGVMEALRDPNVGIIGIYGMAGIGKTTFAKEIARQAKEAKLFSEVVMTCVSQTPDFNVIREEIAEGIKSIGGGRPNEPKDVILILDDVWGNLDMLSIGIPFEPDQKGKKILLISRCLDVLRDMGAEKIFKLEVLSFSESIYLFNKTVRNIIEDTDFRSCGVEIVKECAGLPIAIETLAYVLKDKSLSRWNEVLLQLKQSSSSKIEGIFDKVYSCISTSCNFLSSKEADLLLLCCLHEEDQDIKVEKLMRYGVGWGLFQEVHTLEEARGKVKSFVHKLKSCCLLLDGSSEDTVTMNKVVRDVATSIAAKEKQAYCIPNVAKLEECLEEEKLKESKAISLLEYDKFWRLHEGLVCPELKLFFMLQAFGLPIPDSFFDEAKVLRCLSLNGACLESLPSSFYLLQNLETLCLCSCDIKNIDLIGDLKNLKVLDLSESTIEELPENVGKLTRLRLLDLRGCQHLRAVRKNSLSNLVQLEELYMAEEYDKWEVEGVNVEGSNFASLTELKSMQQLTVLCLNILDTKVLPKDLFSGELERYRICVGGKWSFDGAGISRSLYLNLDVRSQLNELGLQLLIERSEELVLEGLTGLENVVPELDEKGFTQLKRLQFHNNGGVHYMVNFDYHDLEVFRSLESLYLWNLTYLESVYKPEIATESFKKLREVRVMNCPRLVVLFPDPFVVKRLQYIEVEGCERLSRISYSYNVGSLELRFLTLKSLPELSGFFSDPLYGRRSLPELSGFFSFLLEPLDARPSTLFSEEVSFPKLEELTLHTLNVRELWPRELQSTSYGLQNLKSLHVEDCNELSHLLPHALAKTLVQLKELRVRKCQNMKVLVEKQRGDRWEDISFSKLETLELNHLPRLVQFYEAACLNCPSLLKLTIIHCERLRLVLFAGVKERGYFRSVVTCPILDELNLSQDSHISHSTVSNILQGKNLTALHMMETLTSFNLKSCGLKHLIPYAAAITLVQLRNLEINDCCNIEEVVYANEMFENVTVFPKLESLGLTNLPMLKSFCEEVCRAKFQSLLKLTVTDCPELKTLVTHSMPMPEAGDDRQIEEADMEVTRHRFSDMGVLIFPSRLEELNFSSMEVVKLSVDQLPSNYPYMQNLKSLAVGKCNKLKFLFSSTAVGRLSRLKQLHLYECMALEEVLVTKEAEEDTLEDISFPKLEALELQNLPNLKWFCAEACVSCPSLLRLSVEECPNLVSISISHMPTQITTRNEIVDQEMNLMPGKSLQRVVTFPIDWEN